METTPSGTAVGVDDPYEHVERCDHLTDDGRCRFAVEHRNRDPAFAREREAAAFRCPVGTEDWEWSDCSHFCAHDTSQACVRCGLESARLAHSEERPLLETHHLSYRESQDGAQASTPSHEITVTLCRWCHARVHNSWARIDDDASPTEEAIAARQARRTREQAEFEFRSAAQRKQE